MNKKITFLVVMSLLAIPSLVLGETYTGSVQEQNVIKKQNEEKRENLKKEMEQKKEEIKNSFEERKQNATDKVKKEVYKFVKNMNERLDTAINRLIKLADRIDSRITKMEAGKIDVTKAKALMVTARAKIEIAKISVSLVVAPTFASTTASTTASSTVATIKDAYKITKTQIKKAKADIKLAHEALINVVENLKPGKNKTATTTESESED